jgi:hypothetical protein
LTRKVQEGLTFLGYDPGEADGIYGRKTRKGIEKFQERHGLAVDGKVTSSLLDRVEKEIENTRRNRQKAGPQSNATPTGRGGVYSKAKRLYENRKYDEVIGLLSDPASSRDDYDSDMLLARAQLKKCALLKKRGDESYKTLVQEPYRIGLKYRRVNPTLHEPYYITALSLLINDRPSRAINSIRRAINLSPGNGEYFLLRGDAFHVILGREKDPRMREEFYTKGRMAYDSALELAGGNDELASKVQNRIDNLTKTMEAGGEEVVY